MLQWMWAPLVPIAIKLNPVACHMLIMRSSYKWLPWETFHIGPYLETCAWVGGNGHAAKFPLNCF